MRLDKYLKVSRLIKRRTVANEACDNGRVTLNGKTARASAEVKPGDVIGISFGDKEVRAEVLAVQETVRILVSKREADRKWQRPDEDLYIGKNHRTASVWCLQSP